MIYDDSGNLYVGFNGTAQPCGMILNSLARWDGSRWCAVGDGLATSAAWGMSLLRQGDDLYAGGIFGWAGGCDTANQNPRQTAPQEDSLHLKSPTSAAHLRTD